MINLISTCVNRATMSGPYKLYQNLLKGLTQIGYPFVINRDLKATGRLWIHDDEQAIRFLHHSPARKIVGPNVYYLPERIPLSHYAQLREVLYVMPSAWAKQRWEWVLRPICPVQVWPVGIDTDIFHPARSRPQTMRAIVYHKNRDEQQLPYIFSCLAAQGIPYTLLTYGTYGEEDYLRLLQTTTFMIWYGGPETQGIALQEALACNVPVLVYDVPPRADLPVTAAPYFDQTCGLKIERGEQLAEALTILLDTLSHFAPRKYILQHLSLAGQARAFVALWERWGLTFEQGLTETAQSARPWRIPWYYRLAKQWEQHLPSGLVPRVKRIALKVGL